jgi:hypothetical protein
VWPHAWAFVVRRFPQELALILAALDIDDGFIAHELAPPCAGGR